MSQSEGTGIRHRTTGTSQATPDGSAPPVSSSKEPAPSSSLGQAWKRRHQGLLQDKLRRLQAGPVIPSFSVAIRVLLLIRSAGAMYSYISDCDEVFNFLEPLHYFQHNSGFQTWELSPQFAIRSWAYVLLHWPLAYLGPMILRVGKRQEFFALRMCLGFISSYCEAKFYRAVVETINERVGRYMLLAMAFSAGMWSASVAFLPSSFTMYTTMMACTWSFHPASSDGNGVKRAYRATFAIALGAVVGWPFSAAIGLPFVLEQLFLTGGDIATGVALPQLRARRWTTMLGAVSLSACIAIPVFLIDSWAYGRQTFPTANIVLYNIFSSGGPDLYGTSPSWFYLANLFLNFNYLLPFALLSFPALLVTFFIDNRRLGKTQLPTKPGETSPYILLTMRLAPFYLWLGIMSAQAHKEERFMFPVYPLLCLNAAVCVYLIKGWLEVAFIRVTKSPYQASQSTIFSNFSLFTIVFTCILSVSRILAIYHFYSAPFEMVRHFQYQTLPDVLSSMEYQPKPVLSTYKPREGEVVTPEWDLSPLLNISQPLTLCYGTEWYRYPSSYLIPDGVDVRWIRTDFDGMMPRPWEESVAGPGSVWPRAETRMIRPGRFNGDNKDSLEPGTYVEPSQCDYLVALSSPSTHHTAAEPDWALRPEWTPEFCARFLDGANSVWWSRLFWLPWGLLDEGRKWGTYCLLKRES